MANSITIRFDPNNKIDQKLNVQLNEYLINEKLNRKSKQEALKQLIDFGLQIVNGSYHDQELQKLESQINALIRNDKSKVALLQSIIKGQTDIQDTLTDQYTDEELLLKNPEKGA